MQPSYLDNGADAARVVRVGELVIDPAAREIRSCGQVLQLTRLEFGLIHALARQAGRVVPYSDLITRVMGYTDEVTGSALLKTHISHLRSKVAQPSRGRLKIEAALRVGYVLHWA